jgi:glutathione S-transferase
MTLELYMHPLASYCWKVLIALYENETPFEPHLVDLGNEAAAAEFKKLWPIGKFPVLRDAASGRVIPESSSIIEYLDAYHPGKIELVPKDAATAREARHLDRVYDLHVHEHMQKIVGDRIRPAGRKDELGAQEARTKLATAYSLLDEQMRARTWAAGSEFTMADCAAAPALHYANLVLRFEETHPSLSAYLRRLEARPSFARVRREAEPYFHFFPR